MRTNLLATLLAIALPAFVATGALAQDGPKKLKVGSEAPFDIAPHVEFVQGATIDHRDPTKVYVVEFWATWCAPCKKSIPHINQLYQDLNPRGLEVIGISDEPVNTVKSFVREKGSAMSYTIACSKKEDDYISEKFMRAAGLNGIPCAFIISRAGKVCYIGHPMEPDFERILKLTVANRYDPELTARVEPTVAAARRAAKLRNYKEAERLYDQAFAEGPGVLVDVGLENWRMIAEQASNSANASTYIRSVVDRVSKDKYALMAVADYLATDPDIKERDLEAAKYAADKLKSISRAEDSEAFATIASVEAARGDLNAAAEIQYEAWMAAAPSAKPALKRTLDTYNSQKTAGAGLKKASTDQKAATDKKASSTPK